LRCPILVGEPWRAHEKQIGVFFACFGLLTMVFVGGLVGGLLVFSWKIGVLFDENGVPIFGVRTGCPGRVRMC